MNWIEHFRRRAENVDQEIAAEKLRQQGETKRRQREQMDEVEAELLMKERGMQAVSEILLPAEEVFQRIIMEFFHGRGSIEYLPWDYVPSHWVSWEHGEPGPDHHSGSGIVPTTVSRSVKLDCPNPNSYMLLSAEAIVRNQNDTKLTGEFYAHYYPGGRRGLEWRQLPGYPKEKAERGYSVLYTGKLKIIESGTSDFRRKPSGGGDVLVKSDLQEFLEKTGGEVAYGIIRMQREGIK